MDKDFGHKNVAIDYSELNKVPYKSEDFSRERMKDFIAVVRNMLEREYKHAEKFQAEIERSFYLEGWSNGRISGLEDTLYALIDVYNKDYNYD